MQNIHTGSGLDSALRYLSSMSLGVDFGQSAFPNRRESSTEPSKTLLDREASHDKINVQRGQMETTQNITGQ